MEIAIIILVLIGICAALMLREWNRTDARLTAIETQMRGLETANRQRLPYRAMEELLDAMAALDKEKQEMEFHVSLIDNAMGHMTNAMRTGTTKE